jgi:hypothetical protein
MSNLEELIFSELPIPAIMDTFSRIMKLSMILDALTHQPHERAMVKSLPSIMGTLRLKSILVLTDNYFWAHVPEFNALRSFQKLDTVSSTQLLLITSTKPLVETGDFSAIYYLFTLFISLLKKIHLILRETMKIVPGII